MKISVYGIGNFGFAIIKHLSVKFEKNSAIKLFAFDRDKKLVKHLQKTNQHPNIYKNIRIKKEVTFTHHSQEIFEGSDIIILTVSSNAIVSVVTKNQKFINQPSIILNTAKALDYKSGKSFSEIIEKIPAIRKYKCPYAVLSGGTIASDLFHHEPLGADIACKDKKALKLLKKIFTSDNFNIYTTTDVLGVENAGAFKNVISILAGIINGLGFSYGSETHFITRAAHEVTQLLKKKIIIDPYTFSMYSQCWGNDLWMSCTGNTRNREFGTLLGKGHSTAKALAIMKSQHKNVVEGIHTVRALNKLRINNRFPILKGLQSIVLKKANPRKTIWRLMMSNQM